MLIKIEDVVDLPTEPYHPQRIQQLAVQSTKVLREPIQTTEK